MPPAEPGWALGLPGGTAFAFHSHELREEEPTSVFQQRGPLARPGSARPPARRHLGVLFPAGQAGRRAEATSRLPPGSAGLRWAPPLGALACQTATGQQEMPPGLLWVPGCWGSWPVSAWAVMLLHNNEPPSTLLPPAAVFPVACACCLVACVAPAAPSSRSLHGSHSGLCSSWQPGAPQRAPEPSTVRQTGREAKTGCGGAVSCLVGGDLGRHLICATGLLWAVSWATHWHRSERRLLCDASLGPDALVRGPGAA